MELSKKVKVALDETRMLSLGTQILLGFQFRGVFGDGYDQLPADSRYLSGATLGLTICVVGLLITPGPYHRMRLIPLSQVLPHLAFEERGTRSGAGAGVL